MEVLPTSGAWIRDERKSNAQRLSTFGAQVIDLDRLVYSFRYRRGGQTLSLFRSWKLDRKTDTSPCTKHRFFPFWAPSAFYRWGVRKHFLNETNKATPAYQPVVAAYADDDAWEIPLVQGGEFNRLPSCCCFVLVLGATECPK